MKELQYILAQKIGIFCKDQIWKKEMFNKIAEYYRSLDMVDFLCDARIVLKDGTKICFVEAKDKSRGQRFSKVIIQSGVDQQIIDRIIKPCLLPLMSTQCYVVSDDEIRFG